MAIRCIEADMLDADIVARTDIIVQQCNCLTLRPHGLSADLVERLGTYADVYGQRAADTTRATNLAAEYARPAPGTVRFCRPPTSSNTPLPIVACLFAQWAPGNIHAKQLQQRYPPCPTAPAGETAEMRRWWFQQALERFRDAIETMASPPQRLRIAIPWKIGCGLAGGQWSDYEPLVRQELEPLLTQQQHEIVFYRKPA